MSRITQSMPNFGEEETKAVHEYMKSGGFITEYKQTSKLESQLSEYIKTKHCIMTTSGTTALILSLLSLDIGEGDEVIVPDYTMIASVNAIKITGATPVIVDIHKDTFTLDFNIVKSHLSLKTKAILHVSLNNRADRLEELNKLCEEKKIYLVEDAAQSLGCLYKGKHFGTYGKIGCFSLSTPKIISTGQGGFIVTDDDNVASKARMIKNFGRRISGNDNFACFGINLKFTDLQAVIGHEQIKKLPYRVKRMREIYDLYYKRLNNTYKMIKPPCEDWIPWFIDIYVENREEIMEYLSKNGVQTRPGYPQASKTGIYPTEETFPNSSYVSSSCLFLPSHTLLSDEDIEKVCSLLLSFKK